MRIGIDLGGTKTEGILLDAAGVVCARERLPTPADRGYEAIIETIVALILRLETVAGCPCTVGIGAPGSLSHRTATIKNANTTALNGRPLGADLARLLRRPVRLENDANCLALSEATDGAGYGHRVVFAVILGTGVGGGIVVDGQLWTGCQHIAGEWGHNRLEADGPPCYCGRRGCIETLLSGPGLAADYGRHGGSPAVTAAAVTAAAAEGEPAATAALQRFCARLGQALAMVVNILDPDIIVVGGGLSAISDIYTTGRRALAAAAFTDDCITPLVAAAHGPSSGVRGAAHLWDATPPSETG